MNQTSVLNVSSRSESTANQLLRIQEVFKVAVFFATRVRLGACPKVDFSHYFSDFRGFSPRMIRKYALKCGGDNNQKSQEIDYVWLGAGNKIWFVARCPLVRGLQ